MDLLCQKYTYEFNKGIRGITIIQMFKSTRRY